MKKTLGDGILFALGSGICAALASVAGKIAFDSQSLRDIVEALTSRWCESAEMCQIFLDKLNGTLRLLTFGLMFVLNGAMWNFFAKCLAVSKSTLEATVLSNTCNFLCTALCGSLLFGEKLSLLFWVGCALTLAGLALVNSSTSDQQEEKLD